MKNFRRVIGEGLSTARHRVAKLFRKETLKGDVTAGLVLGVESVPDGLASGLLAGVNPIAGLYGYLYGMVGAAFFTSSTFMAVQATGAMALVVADVDLDSRPDPARALFTLAMLTGVVMIIAGVFKAGRLLRFVPTAVMTGFITAVGINIILGQLGNFTGYDAEGDNRIVRTVNLIIHPLQIHPLTLIVGGITLVLIVLLTSTPLKSMGLVIAVVVGSVLAFVFNLLWPGSVLMVQDIAEVPNGLPGPALPAVEDILYLAVPALSLAFVGLIQGAAVSAGVPNRDGVPADASKDFIGQGVGNIVAGLFRGMPVGGSMSASALVVAGGAKTRLALFVAGGVMAVVILLLSGIVGQVAMPALAALLIVVGFGSIKPSQIVSVFKTGPLQTSIMVVTLVLTMVIPLQFAVLVGVGLGIIMFVAEQSNKLTVRQLEVADDGSVREFAPMGVVLGGQVVALQPYGSLFFASAPTFQRQLPTVTEESTGAVVIIRLRGVEQLGLSLIEVLTRYARSLHAAGASMKLVISSPRVREQFEVEGVVELVGAENIYMGTEWLGRAVRTAYRDAQIQIDADKLDFPED